MNSGRDSFIKEVSLHYHWLAISVWMGQALEKNYVTGDKNGLKSNCADGCTML